MKRLLAIAALLALPPLEGRHRLAHGFRVGFGCAF